MHHVREGSGCDRFGTVARTVRTKLDSLTGLRWLAALAVFLFHVTDAFSSPLFRSVRPAFAEAGVLGVTAFFVLSGFVLTWSRRAGDEPGRFYRRRFARIYPNHFVTWVAAGALVLLGSKADGNAIGVVASLLLVHAWSNDHAVILAMNNVSWTLSVEAFFYAVFPFLLPRLLRVARATRLVLALAGVAAGLALLAEAVLSGYSAWFAVQSPLALLTQFAIGCLVALEVERDRWRVPVWGAVALVAASYAWFSTDGWHWLSLPALTLSLAALIASLAQRDRRGEPSFLRADALVRLGAWSYAFYLVHFLVIRVVANRVSRDYTNAGSIVLTVGCFAGALAASALLYRVIEHPLERLLRGQPGGAVPGETAAERRADDHPSLGPPPT